MEDNGGQRHIVILMNPNSGDKQAFWMFKFRLQPILEEVGLKYTLIGTPLTSESTGENFVPDWVEGCDPSEFTDIVLLGGDGLFSQYINAVHFSRPEMLEIPVGLMPAGSTNALCCDIGS